MAVLYVMCGTTNKNRGEQDGVENDPCFTAATLLDRVLDNPPATKSHNQKRKGSKTELLKNRQEKPNFATKREQNTHDCTNLRVDATTFSLQPSQPSRKQKNENKTPRPPELDFAVMRTEKCTGVNN
jgi:hypothetical protein